MDTDLPFTIQAWPPEGVRLIGCFRVDGEPKGAGSKSAIPAGKRDATGRFHPYTRPDGMPIVNVVDSSGAPGKKWRKAVAAAFREVIAAEPHDGPIAMRLTFSAERPAAQIGTGRNAGVVKASAPALPHASALADGTKLTRALEDALNEVAYTDDRRVCDLWWSRRYGSPGVDVEIFAMPNERGPEQPSLLDDPADAAAQHALLFSAASA